MPEKVASPHRRICQKASVRSQIPAVEMRACFQSFCHTCGESDGWVLCKEDLDKGGRGAWVAGGILMGRKGETWESQVPAEIASRPCRWRRGG